MLGWTLASIKKNTQAKISLFETFLETSERSPNSIETDDGNKLGNKIFTELPNENKLRRQNSFVLKRTAFAERYS